MNLTIKESMEKEIYEVSNVMGMAIECYPFKGSITDSREKEVQMDGVGFTIYNAEVSLDEDGCYLSASPMPRHSNWPRA